MKGHLQQRGPNRWRLKFDVGRDPGTGKRVIRYSTVHGTKREAQVEFTRQIAAIDGGSFVEPSKLTVAEYMRGWIATVEAVAVSPKTAERYRQLIEGQIVPHLGALLLQRLRPTHVANWHASLLRSGRHDGCGLSARTVRHAHRVLHKALEDAIDRELLTKNPVSRISPPKIEGPGSVDPVERAGEDGTWRFDRIAECSPRSWSCCPRAFAAASSWAFNGATSIWRQGSSALIARSR